MKVNLMDFFEGIEEARAKQIIEVILGKRKWDMKKDEFKTIIKNSTEVFRSTTQKDLKEFEKESETNKLVLHFIAGNNTDEFLNVK